MKTAELNKYLTQGGDERISLDSLGYNSYGGSIKSTSEFLFSSSTYNNPSIQGEAYARQRMLSRGSYREEVHSIRNFLRSIYGIEDNVDIALAPSGTDLEYLILQLGVFSDRPVVNLLAIPHEVGTGALNAGAGKYFSSKVPFGKEKIIGHYCEGFDGKSIQVFGFYPDEYLKAEKNRIDECLNLAKVKKLVKNNKNKYYIIHILHGSKINSVWPTFENIKELQKASRSNLVVAVDACQGRISREYVKKYLNQNCVVFLTGSKFYGGPPFSAAALFPKEISSKFKEIKNSKFVAKGLNDFFNRAEFPDSWKAFDAKLSNNENWGLLTRWFYSIPAIKEFYSLSDQRIRNVTDTFSKLVSDNLNSLKLKKIPFIFLEKEGEELEEALRSTIQTIEILDINGRPVEINELKSVYSKLYKENPSLPPISQPVKILSQAQPGVYGSAIRLALNSATISKLAGLLEYELVRVLDEKTQDVFKVINLLSNKFTELE